MAEIAPQIDELEARIREAETNGKPIREKLPGWGWVRFDQLQPFLCVYRRPPGSRDRATAGLLAPIGAHIVCQSGDDRAAGLINGAVRRRIDAFGACLLLEIWCTREGPGLTLHLPDTGDHTELVETFERGWVAARPHRPLMELDVQYGAVQPPDRPALPLDDAKSEALLSIGLAVAPTYLDSETGMAFPLRFRALRAALSHVVKQVVFEFAHAKARSGPVHFHEFGPGEVEDAVWAVDDVLADLADDFELLLHVTPTNVGAAWQAFKAEGYRAEPDFRYRPLKVDPSEMKRALFSIPIETVEDPAFHRVFDQKQQELDRQMSMVRDRAMPEFLYASVQTYGRVDGELTALADRVLDLTTPQPSQPERLDARALAEAARAEVRVLQRQDESFEQPVEVHPDTTGLLVSNGVFYVGEDATVSLRRLRAAIQHEVGTHMLTFHNGSKQPLQLLRTGLAGYDALQEGLAVLAEYLVGGLEVNRLRQLAARVHAVAAVEGGADFVQTVDLLRDKAELPYRGAFLTAMRVHRGGGFTKDAVYLRGLAELLARLSDGLDLERLLIGKMGFDQLHLVEEMTWRGLLKPAPLRPSYLDDPEAIARFDALKARPRIETLIEGAL